MESDIYYISFFNEIYTKLYQVLNNMKNVAKGQNINLMLNVVIKQNQTT